MSSSLLKIYAIVFKMLLRIRFAFREKLCFTAGIFDPRALLYSRWSMHCFWAKLCVNFGQILSSFGRFYADFYVNWILVFRPIFNATFYPQVCLCIGGLCVVSVLFFCEDFCLVICESECVCLCKSKFWLSFDLRALYLSQGLNVALLC